MIFDFAELLESNEQLLCLNEACKKFRPPISRPTMERLIRDGVRGCVLRTILVGSRRFTTESEIRRFSLAQLQNPAPNDATNDASARDIPRHPKRPMKKTGGMTPEEISAGLARHKLPQTR
jgi:hypothetical protein